MTKNNRVRPRKLKGFRDYAPDAALTRRKITDVTWETARRAGFQPIVTPALEYSETLLGSGSQDTDKEIYGFEDHGGRQVALRFDLTMSFARFVAENQGTLIMPFKKVQIGDSWRGEKPQKGRFREFCQADLDIVGTDSLMADVEVIASLHEIIGRILPGSYSMLLGNRVILSALIRACMPGLQGGENAALIALDKLAKIGRQGVIDLLEKLPGGESAGAEKILAVLEDRTEEGDTNLDRVEKLVDEPTRPEIARLRETAGLLRAGRGNDRGRIVVDLSIARGLGYYTGIVFETFVDDLPDFGSISSGGRYNQLVSRFSSREVPGVGGSVGVDRLLAALEELKVQVQPDSGNGLRVFVAVASPEARAQAFDVALRLRRAGITTDIGMQDKLAKQFKFADRSGFDRVVTIGSDELANGVYTVKDLKTGTELKDQPLAGLEEQFR